MILQYYDFTKYFQWSCIWQVENYWGKVHTMDMKWIRQLYDNYCLHNFTKYSHKFGRMHVTAFQHNCTNLHTVAISLLSPIFAKGFIEFLRKKIISCSVGEYWWVEPVVVAGDGTAGQDLEGWPARWRRRPVVPPRQLALPPGPPRLVPDEWHGRLLVAPP